MARARQNHDRESRIHEEIIVDTYGLEEQAMSWYYYLEDKLQFPFHAQCVASVPTSPLRKGDTIEIRKMAAEDTLLLMEDKKTLAEILERFNRKERNLLIRHILDCCGKPPRLGQNFCDWLAEYAGIPGRSLDHAWWATDFHFDWLAGALLAYVGGEPVRCNTPMSNDGATGVRLVMGNQEDVDLVIVAHDREARTNHLILLEAKAYSPDDPEQYERKLNRLNLLNAFYTRLKEESPQKSESSHEIVFHLIRYPPPNNEGVGPVRLPQLAKITTERKGTNRTLKWSESPMTVTRCNEIGKPDKKGAHWKCKPS